MHVLIACEFSGVVRDAFNRELHDAWSADLLPSEKDGPHLQGDVAQWLSQPWDLLIAHPPCTYLCNSGVRWLSSGGRLDRKRHRQMKLACDFFARLFLCDAPRCAVENPIMHKYARDYLRTRWCIAGPSQIIQPWQFGHPETKATCLWLRGLPLLKPSRIVSGRNNRVHFASPGPDRWKERSRTLPGLARAMARQWGAL